MTTVIKNGTIVTADRTWKADILVEGGKIAKIGDNLSGDTALDATGCYVMPGGIDPHTHLEMPFMGTYSSDDFESRGASQRERIELPHEALGEIEIDGVVIGRDLDARAASHVHLTVDQHFDVRAGAASALVSARELEIAALRRERDFAQGTCVAIAGGQHERAFVKRNSQLTTVTGDELTVDHRLDIGSVRRAGFAHRETADESGLDIERDELIAANVG